MGQVLLFGEYGLGDELMNDLIDEYLELIAGDLRGPAIESHRTLLETEDHLRQSVSDLMEQGFTPEKAQQEAIARFGTATVVAQGHNAEVGIFSLYATFRALVASAVELIAAGFIVIGISAAVAYIASLLTSRQAIFGLPASAQPSVQQCSYWLSIHPTAANCQQAGTWEAAADSTLMLGIVGVVGVILFAIMRVLRRSNFFSVKAVPALLSPAIATAMFFLASVGLFIVGHGNATIEQAWGQGRWYSESATGFAAAIISALFLLRAIRKPFQSDQNEIKTFD